MMRKLVSAFAILTVAAAMAVEVGAAPGASEEILNEERQDRYSGLPMPGSVPERPIMDTNPIAGRLNRTVFLPKSENQSHYST